MYIHLQYFHHLPLIPSSTQDLLHTPRKPLNKEVSSATRGGKSLSRKRVTIRDVAKAANVSSSTVSNVLNNNDYHVSEETKRAVLQAIRTLGYKPPAGSRRIKSRTLDSLAIVISQAKGPHILSEPMTAEAMRGITDYAKKLGCQILLHITEGWDPVHYEQTFHEQRATSAVILGALRDDPLLKRLTADRIPFVTINHEGSGHPNVGPDHHHAGELLVQHALKQGRSRIAVLTDAMATFQSSLLLSGVLQALFVAGVHLPTTRVLSTDTSQEGGMAATAALLDADPDIDTIITTDDLVAIGAVRELERREISVPKQCAVYGYGNTPAAALTRPPLSSVELRAYSLGRQAMRWLSGHLRDDVVEPVDVRLPVELVVRETC